MALLSMMSQAPKAEAASPRGFRCAYIHREDFQEDFVFRSSGKDPDLHLGNYKASLHPVRTPIRLAAKLEQLRPELHLRFPKEQMPLTITRLSKIVGNQRFIELEAPLGSRYLKAETDGEIISFLEVSRNETPFANLKAPLPDPAKTSFDLKDLPENWAEQSAKRQEGSYEKDWRLDNKVVGLLKANQMIERILRSGDELTLSLIEDLNFELRDRERGSGIARGSKPKFKDYPQGKYLVDMEFSQVRNAYPEYMYVPAGQVLSRLNTWLKRANRVGPQTTLLEITKLYQDFVIIHPFTDGNGRTSRVLLDYLLVKAGFPPLNHSDDTRQIIFRTPEELRDALAGAFQTRPPH